MKISSGTRTTPDVQTAWGFLTLNLAVPGLGTLMTGRKTGYLQALLGVAGFVLTNFFGFKFLAWYLRHLAEIQDLQVSDPLEAWNQVWSAVSPALLAIACFLVAQVWALGSSICTLRAAKARQAREKPPILG